MEEVKYEDLKKAAVVDPDLLTKVVGLALDIAQGLLKEAGVKFRILEPDAFHTLDYQFNRINLVVVNNVVSEARLG